MPSSSDENTAPSSDKVCSSSKCKTRLPIGYDKKTCIKCCEKASERMARKRKRDKEDQGSHRKLVLQPTTTGNGGIIKENAPQDVIYVESDEELTSDENPVSIDRLGL